MHLLLHLPAAMPSTEGPTFGPGRGFPKLGAGGATEGQGDHPHRGSRGPSPPRVKGEPSPLQGIAGHWCWPLLPPHRWNREGGGVWAATHMVSNVQRPSSCASISSDVKAGLS